MIYLHLDEAAVAGVTGVVRAEGLGPHSLQQLADLVGHHHITVKPVIDLAQCTSTTAYEHPDDMKERIHLRHGGDAFPHASSQSRHLDIDHVRPYDHTARAGPVAQTTSHHSQPLSRTAHRAKTHLAYQCRQTTTGETI